MRRLQERWLEEDAEFWKGPANGSASSGDKNAEVVRGRRYLPFGDGVRSCVGQSLAKMNYTATLALLLSHFRFRLADRVSATACAQAMVSPVLGSMQMGSSRRRVLRQLSSVALVSTVPGVVRLSCPHSACMRGSL